MNSLVTVFLSSLIVASPIILGTASVADASLPQGTTVISGTDYSAFNLGGQGSLAEYSSTPVEGQPFKWAVQVKVAKRTGTPDAVKLASPAGTAPLKKGDEFLAVFFVRCTASADGWGRLYDSVEHSQKPWAGIGPYRDPSVIVDKRWKQVFIHGKIDANVAAGQYDLAMDLGFQTQTLEFGGLQMFDLGPNADDNTLPVTAITYPGEEPDAPWRKAAAERIEKYRKGDLTVRVVGRNNQPIPGAKVHVEMQRQAYGFGTFFEPDGMTGTGPDVDKLREWTLKMFNRGTVPLYWMDNAWPDPAARSRFLQCAQWGADHHFNLRGHPVFYPAWQFSPASLASLKQDQPALRKAVLDHIVDVMEQTRQFNFTEYDVTNELRWLGGGGDGITGTLGGRPAVAEWFKVAREHAPASARLGINENTNLEWGGLTNDAQNNYFGWIQYLMDQGVGPDVIGLQAHFDTATGPEAMLQILDRFAAFGKPIQITEFDFLNPDEQSQGKFTRDFLTAVFSHPATDAITAWGFWEGRMWRPGAALVRKDWSLKPSGQAWMDLVRTQWWTDVNSATGADGICATRGFLGDYKITVDAGGKQAFTEVKLDKQGATAVFVVE